MKNQEHNINQIETELKLECVNRETETYRQQGQNSSYCINKEIYLEFLKQKAELNRKTQSRICFHENNNSALQNMLVYHSKEHKVKKHTHCQKDEYLLIIKGSMTINIYKEGSEMPKESYLMKQRMEHRITSFALYQRVLT